MNSATFTSKMANVRLMDGVLITEITDPQFTVADFREHIALVRAHFSEVQFPIAQVMSSPKTNGSSTKELREFVAGDEFAAYAACVAMITQSFLLRAAANLFLKVSRPRCPTQLFADEAKAMEWARGFVSQKS